MTDDFQLEPEDGEGSELSLQERLKELRQKLSNAEKECASNLEGWQRAKADYVNLKRRAEEERSAAYASGLASGINELLPFIDSFDEAMKHADIHTPLGKGLAKTAEQLESALKSLGVLVVGQLQEKFDPNVHESVTTVAVSNVEDDNTVITVLQKGYTLNGRTLRPARVAVGHYKDK